MSDTARDRAEDLTATVARSLAMSYGSHINAPKGGKDWKAAEDLMPLITAEIAAAERRGAAEALRNFADAHRFPSAWVMFRRVDDSPVSVGDLLRETADRIEGDDDDRTD